MLRQYTLTRPAHLFDACRRLTQDYHEGKHYPLLLQLKQLPSGERNQAYRYLFGVLLTALSRHEYESTGQNYPVDALHEYFARRWIPPKTEQVFGESVTVRRSINDLVYPGEVWEYIGKIEAFCAERGVMMPARPGTDLMNY